MLDEEGYRYNVGVVLLNAKNQVLWACRSDFEAWQFPQGGMYENETPIEALYRELKEEVGLEPDDVELIAESQQWLTYRLPPEMVKKHIGQKQKWFLLRLLTEENRICLDQDAKPEFCHWQWVDYWYPIGHVISFKQPIYEKILTEFSAYLPPAV